MRTTKKNCHYLRCSMSKVSSSLGRAIETDMMHINEILRYLRSNPGVTTAEPMQISLEAAQRSVEESFLTFSVSDWAADSDNHSVSGTASWIRGNTPLSVVVKLRWFLRHLERAKEWDCDSCGAGLLKFSVRDTVPVTVTNTLLRLKCCHQHYPTNRFDAQNKTHRI